MQPVALNTEDSAYLIKEQLQPFFTALWRKDNSQFKVPEDYGYFLSFSSTGRQCDKKLGLYFYYPQLLIDNTKAGYTPSEDDELPSDQTIWIEVAHWSDKHDIFLCCDPLSSRFGSVIDCHDGHPCFSLEACYPIALDFLSYLRSLTF